MEGQDLIAASSLEWKYVNIWKVCSEMQNSESYDVVEERKNLSTLPLVLSFSRIRFDKSVSYVAKVYHFVQRKEQSEE